MRTHDGPALTVVVAPAGRVNALLQSPRWPRRRLITIGERCSSDGPATDRNQSQVAIEAVAVSTPYPIAHTAALTGT